MATNELAADDNIDLSLLFVLCKNIGTKVYGKATSF